MLRIKLIIFSLVCAGLFLTSCEDDLTGSGGGGGGGIGGANAPFLTFPGGLDIIDDGAILEPGATFRVLVEGDAGDNDLAAISIRFDGALLDLDAFDILETADEDSNPTPLNDDFATTFSATYEIIAPIEPGFYTYEFALQDISTPPLVTTESITIEVQGETVSPILDIQFPGSVILPAGSIQIIPVNVTRGTFEIASISIWENDSTIQDLSRIRFNGVDFESNPMPLFAPDTEGFDAEVSIVSTTGVNDYVIRVTDTEDNSTDFVFEIIEDIPSTPLEGNFATVMFANNSGPDLGAVDLDNGVAVTGGATIADVSPEAELRDLGIDNGPVSSNWRQQIQAVNDATLRIVDLSTLPESFTFAGVMSKEEVQDAFDAATTVTETPALQAGDLLAVSSPRNIYLVRIDEINATDNNNRDSYSISIKF